MTCTVYSVSLSVSSAGWVDLKRGTPGSGRTKANLYGVLCLALGELCWLGGPEEGAQVQARQLRHVSQLLCGGSRQPWEQVGENHGLINYFDTKAKCRH